MARTRQHQVLLSAAVAAVLAGTLSAGLVRARRRRRVARPAETRTGATGVSVTQATVPINPADAPMGRPGSNTEQRLDEGIQETFPASDPVSVRIE